MSCPVDCPAGNAAASIFGVAATVNLHERLKILPLMGWRDAGATVSSGPRRFLSPTTRAAFRNEDCLLGLMSFNDS